MPNTFAYVVLFTWPIVVFVLYRRLPRAEALIATILGGYLLLPNGVGYNPPVLPTLNKTLIPVLSALLMVWLVPAPPDRRPRVAAERAPTRTAERSAGRSTERSLASDDRAGRSAFTRQRAVVSGRGAQAAQADAATEAARPRISRVAVGLLVLLFVTPFVTYMQNGDSFSIGPRFFPGLRLYDAFSMSLNAAVSVLPFLLAQRYLSSPHAHRLLLRGLTLWGLVYTLPALFEVRMSPQLARWVYGFLAQSFLQTSRDGGWRPVVFLPHGLWLAIFFAMTILAAATLWRLSRAEGSKTSGRWLLAFLWLLGTLVLCHSAGALVIAVVLLPFVLMGSVRGQLLLASVVAGIVLTYPALRGANLIPVDQIVSMAQDVSPQRAASLEFRLKNEDQLLERARQKPLAGWGGWGRSRIYDPKTGQDLTVTDGAWIITVSDTGWMGYIARYGLLTAGIFLLTLRFRQMRPSFATSGLALILVANLIDMIMNGTITPLTWLVAGALMGRAGQATAPAPDSTAKHLPGRMRPGPRRAETDHVRFGNIHTSRTMR